MITSEMAELRASLGVLDAANEKVVAAQSAQSAADVELRAAMRERENAKSRHAKAVEALERSCRAALPTLPGDPS